MLRWLLAILFGLVGLTFYGGYGVSLASIYTDIAPLQGMREATFAGMTPEQVEYTLSSPAWYIGLTVLATVFGVLGALTLLVRAALARLLLLLALVTTIAAFGTGLFIFNEAEKFGNEAYVGYSVVALISLVIWLVSLFASRRP